MATVTVILKNVVQLFIVAAAMLLFFGGGAAVDVARMAAFLSLLKDMYRKNSLWSQSTQCTV